MRLRARGWARPDAGICCAAWDRCVGATDTELCGRVARGAAPGGAVEETLEAATFAYYRSGRARWAGLSRSSHWQPAEAVTRGVVQRSAADHARRISAFLVDAACASTVARNFASRVMFYRVGAGRRCPDGRTATRPPPIRVLLPIFVTWPVLTCRGFANSVNEATHRGFGPDRRTETPPWRVGTRLPGHLLGSHWTNK